jgi:hypothetical protein
MSQPLFPQFVMDVKRGETRKEQGMKISADSRAELLSLVRAALRNIARTRPSRTATADDATEWLIAYGYDPNSLGNGAGSLFRGDDWVFTGVWVKSRKVTNHAHQNRVWRLK